MRVAYAEGRARLFTALTIHPMCVFPKSGFETRSGNESNLGIIQTVDDLLHCGRRFGRRRLARACLSEHSAPPSRTEGGARRLSRRSIEIAIPYRGGMKWDEC